MGCGGQFGDGLLESGLDVVEIIQLTRAGLDEVDQVAVGGQVAFLDHRRGGNFKIHVAEQAGVVFVLFIGLGAGQGGGQADDVRIVQLADEIAQGQRPVVEQVMALVQHNGADAAGGQVGDQGAGVGVQEALQLGGVSGQQFVFGAFVAFGNLAAVSGRVILAQGLDADAGGGFVGRLALRQERLHPFLQGDFGLALLLFAGGGDQLVGVNIDVGQSARIEAGDGIQPGGIGQEHPDFFPPLGLDGGCGREDDRRRAHPVDQLDADDSFPRSRRRDDMIFAILRGLVNLRQDHALVFAEGMLEVERRHGQAGE